MRFRSPIMSALFLAASAAGPAQARVEPVPDYSNEANWLCLPGRKDACAQPLATTALTANGYGSAGQNLPAKDPPIDCFYVYPTVSRDVGDNSDLVAGPEEQTVATVQFARFASVCRPFAPMYRQATLAALLRQASGSASGTADMLGRAYGDVAEAWRYYLERHNNGRPFVLIGHSQGTIHLSNLLRGRIEGSDAAKRMLSALLIGFNVEVPEGKLVGGTFQKTPLCTRIGETGCIVTFVSFRASNPPPPGAIFGRAAGPGMTVGCTNPARLVGGSAALDSYWYAPGRAANGAFKWSSSGAPPTPFLRTEGLASAACVNNGPLGYLSVVVNADPRDARTDEIPGDVTLAGRIARGWGLHTADMNLAMGDLIRLVEAQARGKFAKSPR